MQFQDYTVVRTSGNLYTFH